MITTHKTYSIGAVETGARGERGYSAYELWLQTGNKGTEEDFFKSLKGDKGFRGSKGLSAYETWLSLEGNEGKTEQDFINSLKPTETDIKSYTKEEINKLLEDGTLSNIMIKDESVTTSKIKNKSITFEKISFFNVVESINKFNKNAVTNDGYILNGTGGYKAQEDCCVSDYIMVKESDIIRSTSNWNGELYDEHKNFIEQKPFGVYEYTVPAKAKYYRQSINKINIDTTMITVNHEIGEYIPYYIEFTANDMFDNLINKTIKPFKNKKWAAIGDSITEKNVTSSINYTDIVTNELGLSCINHGIGGTGYKRGEENLNAFYQRVKNIEDSVDVITLFGSGNDLKFIANLGEIEDDTTDTLCGCINKTIDNLIDRFPTKPIGIISPTPWRGNTPNIKNSHMMRYVEKLEQICKRRGIPYLDLYYHSNLHPDNEKCLNLTFYNKSAVDGNGDGVHPNNIGHKLISPMITNFIKTLL